MKSLTGGGLVLLWTGSGLWGATFIYWAGEPPVSVCWDSVGSPVQKFLVQLGFSPAVCQQFHGQKIQIMTTMRPMIAKLPRHHWPNGQIPASTVANEIVQDIPIHAFDDIIWRETQSASYSWCTLILSMPCHRASQI